LKKNINRDRDYKVNAKRKLISALSNVGINTNELPLSKVIELYKSHFNIASSLTGEDFLLQEYKFGSLKEEPKKKKKKFRSHKPSHIATKKQRKKNDKKTYQKFLNSPYWKMVRKEVLQRDKKMCTKCGSTADLQVHHLTYVNHGNEMYHLEDLVTLCEICHKKEHNIKH
jgi:5-methylcytosine-specific restriction endonuclease McrA